MLLEDAPLSLQQMHTKLLHGLFNVSATPAVCISCWQLLLTPARPELQAARCLPWHRQLVARVTLT